MGFSWTDLMPSIVSAGNNTVNNLINWRQASMARQNAWSQINSANNFSLYMSNTAHQREVEDLKKAGINPLYTVNGGSGAYSMPGSISHSAQASAAGGSDPGAVYTSAKMARLAQDRLSEDTKNIEADIGVKNATVETERRKQALLDAQRLEIASRIPAVQSAAALEALQNDYEFVARKYLYNDKDYVGRDMGMRKMNLILPAALQTVNTARGVVNTAALVSHAHSYGKLADRPHLGMVREFSNGMSYTDNYF